MKKITKKLLYFLLMVAVISAMLLLMAGPLYACEKNTLTVTVHKAIEGEGFGDFTFQLIKSNGDVVKDTDTISSTGGTVVLTWEDWEYDSEVDVYVKESGTGGAESTFWGWSDPASTGGTQTDTFEWDREEDKSIDVYFKNVITEEEPRTGRVNVTKVVDNIADDATSFPIDISGMGSSISETGGPAVFDLAPGVYTLSEINLPAGYALVGIESSDATDLDPSDVNFTFEIGVEGEINFVITNTGPTGPGPSITVAAITEEVVEVEAIEEEEEPVVVEVAAIEELPRTGNNMLFYVIGFALMAVGIAFGSILIPKALRRR